MTVERTVANYPMPNSGQEPNTETSLVGIHSGIDQRRSGNSRLVWPFLVGWRHHARRISTVLAGLAALGTVFGGLTGYWTVYQAANDWIRDDQTVSRPSRLSIAVLPFENISGDPSQEYLGVGLTENVTTYLAVSMPTISLITGQPAVDRETPGPRRKRVGRKQNAQYLLSGSILRIGGRVQVNARLTEAIGGAQLWADRIEAEASDTVSVQDQVAARIATSLQFILPAVYIRDARRKSDDNAMDVLLRGKVALDDERRQGLNPLIQAEGLFRAAAELEPQNPDALGSLAAVVAENLFNSRLLPPGRQPTPDQLIAKRREVDELLERTTQTLPASSVTRLARALLHLHEQRLELARMELEQARSIDPNDYIALYFLAVTYEYLGLPAQALGVFADIQLRTAGRVPAYHLVMQEWGRCLLLLARWDDAIAKLRQAYAIRASAITSGSLAIAYIQVGDSTKAHFHFQRWWTWYAVSSQPTIVSLNALQRDTSSVPEYLALVNATLFDGYRRLGVPDE